ncbi:chaplin family protein [Actinomadura rupiterrae]|uniref:chaplin family protein n=1 Tax=Actinomadura rupiterrae TaxID=559627 RepID=UPI0020A61B60|nr:chaplin family protein [Actinomadura rupiterrae]MCP2342927.1 hypothetical protein [Actinomadura rupiterrae]
MGTARAAALTASFVALGASVVPASAFADTTDGTSGVLSGNQVNAPISAPINLGGNAVAVAGKAKGRQTGGGATVDNGSGGGGQKTSGRSGVLSGNQVNAPVSAPVNACGNAVAILGTAQAGCRGGATVSNGSGGGGQTTSGKYGVGSGNQLNAPISAPVDACGNAIAIFGKADAGCRGGASVTNKGSGGQKTSGESGVLAGNQAHAPVSAPVDVCGNAAGAFGDAVAGCKGGAVVKNGGHTGAGQKTSGTSSVGGGNQVDAPISAPVSVCGNGAVAECDGGASVRNGGHGSGGQTTDGDYGVLSGNQVNAPVSAPVSVCGNAVAVLGKAAASCAGGAHVRSSSGGDQHTSGKSGVLAGNQVNAPVTAPVSVCGNAVAVLGEAAAGCHGTLKAFGSNGSGARTQGGNQANAPVKAPVEVCGNDAAVAGHPQPQCKDGTGGGYTPYGRENSDASGREKAALPGPAPEKLLGIRDRVAKLPTSPGAALPALPKLPAASGLPAGLPSGLPSNPDAPGLPALPDTSGVRTLPATAGLPPVPGTSGLPTVPSTSGLPVSPGAAGLPSASGLPTVPGADGVTSLAGGAPRLPASPAALGTPMSESRVPGGTGSGVPVGQLPVGQLPVGQLPIGQLPIGQLPVGQLPVGQLPAGQLPVGKGKLPVKTGQLLNRLPVGKGQLPAQLPLGAARMPYAPSGTAVPQVGSLTRTLPVVPQVGALTRTLPAVPGLTGATTALAPSTDRTHVDSGTVSKLTGMKLPGLDALPVSGNLNVPQVGGVTDKAPVKDLAHAKPMSAEETLTGGKHADSTWVLGAAALLTALSGALTLGRRVRLFRRS